MRALASALLVLGPACVFGYWEKPVEMGVALIAGAIAAAFVNIEKFERFKGAGFEAEMKRAVEQAYATTEALRDVARPLIATTLSILTMGNRLGGMDARQQHDLRGDLERISNELGIGSDTGLKAAHELFFRYQTWDHYSRFIDRVWPIESIPIEVRQQLVQAKSYSDAGFPTREQVNAIFGEHVDKVSQEQWELFEDYLHYRDKRSFRRPEALRSE